MNPYFIIPLLLGIGIGYLLSRLLLSKGHIPKATVEQDFVHKDLHEQIVEHLSSERKANEERQRRIETLERESGSKTSKEDLARFYVDRSIYSELQTKVSQLEGQLRTLNEQLKDSATKLAEAQKDNEFNESGLKSLKEQVATLHDEFMKQFKNVANDVMEEKKKAFASENKLQIGQLLDPLKNDLKNFKEKIEATRKEDIQDITSLKTEISSLQKLNVQLSDDAKNLAMALKSDVKMQGNWGEDRLNMILEQEGLQQYVDYIPEAHVRDADNEKSLRPDFVLKLPEGRHIIIDSKVSLTAYSDYYNASDQDQRRGHLKQHLGSISRHIDLLSRKEYQGHFNSPDYVFMFVPIESALTLALNENPSLLDDAIKKKIIPITPSTLIASLKIVRIIWQKENQVKNVQEIFKQCGELHDKFIAFLKNMEGIEAGLNNASKAYDKAMHDLSSGTKRGMTIIGRFERIKKLEARVQKQIPEKYINMIDVLPDDEVEEAEITVVNISEESGSLDQPTVPA